MFHSTSSIAHGVGRLTNMVLTKGSGSFVWNMEGQKLLDLTSGIAVTSLGHCHPRIVEAVQKQAAELVHGQASVAYHEPMLKYATALVPLLPRDMDSLSFFTTGAEAVENAVKLARHATKKPNVIVFHGGFHGRTIGALSFTTSKTIYKAGFGPLTSGVVPVPYPYTLHSPFSNPADCSDWCLDQVELALKQQTAPSETAAVLIETVMGEGGYVAPPAGFLEGLSSLCSQHDILLIADEVQCGFGRTGKMFAIDGHFNVVPDILVMAKGIANGYPLSAVASRKELTDRQPRGSMGGTYAGNAVSCAAALATLDVFEEESILVNASVRGAQLVAGLTKLQDVYPILDVRGLGLMVAVEFEKSVPPGTATRVSQACVRHGMLLLTTSVYETLRFIPPLNVSVGEVELGVALFAKALADVLPPK